MASGQLGLVLHQLRRMLGGPAADATDRQLLEHYAATGDEPAFTQLVRRHGPMVQGVCRRVLGRDPEADDAFQATFLVLAKKADSAFWQESIGNWLYGVAYRTASKVRARTARRRQVEQEAAGARQSVSTEAGDAHELQQVLDEELIRLPEKFRMPVLLCCLQDQTIDEAGQQLGWSCTTVKGRLQRGREMLRSRLQRRGIGLSAGVLATILTQGVVNATPPALLKSTVQTIVAGTLSDSVSALAQGVMQAMFWTKLKVTAICLLALAVTGIGFGAVFQRFSEVAAKAPLPDEIPVQKAKGPPQTLVVLEKDQGKTLTAVVGQAIEVQLEGDRKQTGWEDGCDPPVAHAKVVTPTSLLVRAGQDFQAQANAADSAIGTYVFKFKALKEGEVELRFVYVSPGGNGYRGPRDATRKVKEFKATVKVSPAPVQSSGAKSEPLLQNGLEVVVQATKARYAADETPAFEITYTNRTDKPFRLHDVGYEVSSWGILDTGTNGPWQAGPWEYAKRPAPSSVELAAGKSHVQTHTLRGPFTWQGNQSKPVKPRDALWPGKFRLTGKIVLGFVRDNHPVPFWSGELTTNPLEFEIGGQPLEAAVKDGLSLTVAPAKAPFAAGETPTFDLAFKNVGDNAFWLHGLGWQRGWDVRIHEAGWAEGYWVPVYLKAAERPNPAGDIVNLKPQAERRERLALGSVKFDWQGPQNRPRGPLEQLPAGKYQVEVRIDFGPLPAGALPGGNRDRHWVGPMASKHAEFEIKAEPAAAPPSVKDANSGLTVTVTDDAKALTARDADGKEIWKLNLIASVKDFLGTPAISSVSINAQGQVEARFGKSNLARIDLKTGKLLEHLAR